MKAQRKKIIEVSKLTKDSLVCYLRVSTKKQSEEGYSLGYQAQVGKKIAKKLGLQYFEMNEGGQSSKSRKDYESDRGADTLYEQFKKLVIKGKIKHLWVINRERWVRSKLEDEITKHMFRKHKVNVYEGVDGTRRKLDTARDRMVDGFIGEIAQADRDERREKSIQGKMYVSKQFGQTRQVSLGGVLFGFRNEQINKSKVLVKHAEEQKILKQMYEMYAKGKSVKDIKVFLESKGIKTRLGNTKWSLGSIQKILQNEKYIGRYSWTDDESGETFNLFLERSISQSLFDRVQKMFAKNQKNKGSNVRKHDSLFGEYLECGCGEGVTSYYQKRTSVLKGEYFTKTYYCMSKHNQWKGKLVKVCNNRRSMDMDKTDDFLLEQIRDVLSQSNKFKDEFKKAVLGRKAKYNNNVKLQKEMIEKRIDFKDKEIQRLYDSIAKAYTDSVLKNNKALTDTVISSLNKEVVKLEQERSEHIEDLKSIDEMQGWVNWVEQCGKSIKERTTNKSKSKLLLDEIIESITVYEVMGESRGKKLQIGHKFDIKFKIALVNDKLIYRDENDKSKGYDLKSGRKTLKTGLSRDLGTSQIRKDNRSESRVKKSVGKG